MHTIRYKPRINLGLVSEPAAYAPLTITTPGYLDIRGNVANGGPQTIMPTVTMPAYMTNKISPPAGFYDPLPVIQPAVPQAVPEILSARDFAPDPSLYQRPEQFRYSKEQLMDMLARGATETFERMGETESGLPLEVELEQISKELDATKQYGIDAQGAIVPVEPGATGAGLGLLAAAVAAFLIFGG